MEYGKKDIPPTTVISTNAITTNISTSPTTATETIYFIYSAFRVRNIEVRGSEDCWGLKTHPLPPPLILNRMLFFSYLITFSGVLFSGSYSIRSGFSTISTVISGFFYFGSRIGSYYYYYYYWGYIYLSLIYPYLFFWRSVAHIPGPVLVLVLSFSFHLFIYQITIIYICKFWGILFFLFSLFL